MVLNRQKVGVRWCLRWQCHIAFRPVCCLLLLAETTHFAFSGGNEEDWRTTKNAFWRVWCPLFWAMVDYKTGDMFDIFSLHVDYKPAKCLTKPAKMQCEMKQRPRKWHRKKNACQWGSVTHPQNEVAFSVFFLGSLSPVACGFWEEDGVWERILPGGNLVFPSSSACPFIIFSFLLLCATGRRTRESRRHKKRKE